MIVKNEAVGIRETLLLARAYVDYYVIIDTGSTDGTQNIVEKTMRGMDGVLVEEPFVNFAWSRNQALDIAKGKAEYTLFLSGDERLAGGGELRAFLEASVGDGRDAFNVEVQIDGKSVWQPRVLRSESEFRYEGELHERPVRHGSPHPYDGARITGAWIEHEPSDPEARLKNVLERHVPMLEQRIYENPYDTMALHYLGDAYGSLAAHVDEQAAITFRFLSMSYYLRRSVIADADNEGIIYAKTQFLAQAIESGLFAPSELMQRAVKLCEEYPDYPDLRALRLVLLTRMPHRKDDAEKAHANVYREAVETAEVADEAESHHYAYPRGTDVKWSSRLIAAQSAAHLAKMNPELRTPGGKTYAEAFDAHIAAASEAGAPTFMLMSISNTIKPSNLGDL
jgi:glycosyltransferase involved in cell wall biosynthesis